MKTKLEDYFKKRLKDLEDKVAQAKAKEREQQSMQKQSESARFKIKSLETEIERMKTQKVTLMKQIKEESEKHRRWKQERVKELMQMKSANVKKDREIQMLKRENKKKELIAKRRQEELNAVIKKSKTDKAKMISAQKDRAAKRKNIDVAYLQNWIVQNTDKMLRFKEYQLQLSQESEQLKEVEEQIREEQALYAHQSVRRDKLEFRKGQLESLSNEGTITIEGEEEAYAIGEELEQLNLEMRAVQDNLDNLEEKNEFIEAKITSIKTSIIEFNPEDIDELKFEEVQSLEGARACLSAFFAILLDVNVYKRQLESQNLQNEATIESLNLQMEEVRQNLIASEINFQKQLDLLNTEYQEKETILLKLIMENSDSGASGHEIEQVLQSLQNKLLPSSSSAEQPSSKSSGVASKKMASKGQTARMEVQKNNQQMYNQSKTALGKRIAELEREKNDDQKRLEAVRHKLEQTNAEKDVIKRQLDTIKTQIKQQGITEIKQYKNIQQSNEQQLEGQGGSQTTKEPQKMHTLRDKRNEMKMKKLGSGIVTNNPQKWPTNEPKAIADEPNDDEDCEEQQPFSDQKERQIESISEPPLQQTSSTKTGDLQAISNVFTRLNQPPRGRSALGSYVELGQSASLSSIQPQPQPQVLTDHEQYEEDQDWKCISIKESAHAGTILAVAQSGNHLYSTSNKSLKIWDFETMSQISDIAAHNNFIRCLTVWGDRKLLLTASDRTIILWDQISLTQVAALRGHKEEIRALAVQSGSQGQLFSAGKGSQNGGSLMIWDLRKSQTPIEEKEKNLDVFCLSLTPDYLYMGCRNHQVYPVNLQTFETMQPFQPPHFDAVTSLALLQDNVLVSGSRDKNLRLWNQTDFSPYSACQDVMSAHTDWINTLETDTDRRMMYSGCKDGIVKVWKMKSKHLKCTASLSVKNGSANLTGGAAINTIAKIDKQWGSTMFATGGSDRQIRVWKYNQISSVQSEDNDEIDEYLQERDGQPDFEMVDDNPSPVKPLKNIDDDFEFEDDFVMGGHGSHPQFQHQLSSKVEEQKQDLIQKVRNFTRSNTGMTGVPNVPQTMTTASMGSKLEQRRRERRFQADPVRKYGQE